MSNIEYCGMFSNLLDQSKLFLCRWGYPLIALYKGRSVVCSIDSFLSVKCSNCILIDNIVWKMYLVYHLLKSWFDLYFIICPSIKEEKILPVLKKNSKKKKKSDKQDCQEARITFTFSRNEINLSEKPKKNEINECNENCYTIL